MKRFSVYRDIRKEALIFGLPVYLFAVQIIAVVSGFLAIIFAFGWTSVLSGSIGNALLYVALLHLKKMLSVLQIYRVFPKHISTKSITSFPDESL